MKVIIYGRVSTASQDVERQIDELQSYCKAQNYEVIEVFTETISGVKTRKQRKEINRLLESVKGNNEIKGVLVWELSRLGRNTLDVLQIIDELSLMKIWVFSKKENLYTLNQDGSENPTTKLTLTILSGVATLERETTLSRSISGLTKSANAGNWTGGAFLPYGYKRVNKKLEIDEEESEVIQMIFRMYLEGNGTKKLSNELNKRKIPTRYNKAIKKSIIINDFEKKAEDFNWKDGTVYSILTNPVYIGKKIGKGNIDGIQLQSPVIINENDFNNVQTKLKTTIKQHSTKFFYLFEGKLKCGLCGKSYFPHKRISKKDNRYICLSKRYNEICDNYGISITKLNDGVWSLLRNNKSELKNIIELNSNSGILENEIHLLNENIEAIRLSINKIQKKEKQILELLLEEKIDKEYYSTKYNSFISEKEKLTRELNELIKELEIKRIYQTKQSDFSSQLKGIKDDKRILKKTINNVVDKIIIYPIITHNFEFKVNKQDKFVYVEVFTYLNEKTPLCFVISQRSALIISPDITEYNKEEKTLQIVKPKELIRGKLFHLKSLD